MTKEKEAVLSEKIGSAVAEPMQKEVKVKYFDLKKYSNGEEIEEALGDNHLFDVAEVYLVVASLISKQSKGEEGALITTGYSNLFYTDKFVLSVDWHSGDDVWVVVCWFRGSVWDVGCRVFSPETES